MAHAHPRMRLPIVLASIVIVAAAACRDLSGPDENDCVEHSVYGSFFGRANGAALDSIAGCAYFTTDTPSGRFGMVLTNGGPRNTSHMVKLFRAARPVDTGRFSVGIGASVTGVIFLGDRRFTLTSGLMIVTGASGRSRLMTGSVDLTGTDDNGASVTIAGSFFARCSPDNGEAKPDRPRQEWSAHCDHPACFPFPCPLASGDWNDTARPAASPRKRSRH